MKVLSPRAHAPIDYLLVALFGLAPTLFGFEGIASLISYVLAVGVMMTSLLTRYPLGVFKVIPFPVHGYIELAAAPLLIAMPFLFGFEEREIARNFFMATGAAYAVVWLITDYKAAETDVRRRGVARGFDRSAIDRTDIDGPHIGKRPMF